MGGCISSTVKCGRSPSRPKQKPNVRVAGPDLSSMELDQLLRAGIAEAQLATVARTDRDRSLHLHRARAVFTQALRKNGSRDPDLREHLLDVLRRLGENARDRVRIRTGTVERQHSQVTDLLSSVSIGRMPSGDQGTSRYNSSELESDESPAHTADYFVMNDGHFTENCETEGMSSTSRGASQGPENAELISSLVNITGDDGTSLLKTASESSSPRDPPSDTLFPVVSNTPFKNGAFELHAASKSASSNGAELYATDLKAMASHEALQSSQHARARLAQSRKSWTGSDHNAPESKDNFGRVRALQPLQASNSRRQAKNMGSLHEVVDTKLDSERNVPHLHSRHSRKQPSQSSSSSQGTFSDSEGSATKRACISLATAIEEEPADFLRLKRPSHKFEPPDRSRMYEAGNEHGDPSSSRHSPATSSYAASSEKSASNDVKTTSDSLTPAEKAASPETSSDLVLEKATSNHECNVQNPLSRLLGGERLPNKTGSQSANASPQPSANLSRSSISSMTSRSSISWPPINPSPLCESATALETRSQMGSVVAASSYDKVSVRILNGVSGEEEVRFPVPLQESFSEQHFYTMLDRLCQKHAGQTLSDLNWLNQSEPNARYQRRKCTPNMLEDFLYQDEPGKRTGPLVLLLCTVPAKPPSEMPANSVRLRNLVPDVICYGTTVPVRLRLETSLLEDGHQYSVAFTHQWTHVTYTAEACLFPTHRGVELSVPWQMLKESGSNTEGLYDVHVVTDFSHRSENRRTLTIGSADSEFSSSSAALSTGQSSFVPLR